MCCKDGKERKRQLLHPMPTLQWPHKHNNCHKAHTTRRHTLPVKHHSLECDWGQCMGCRDGAGTTSRETHLHNNLQLNYNLQHCASSPDSPLWQWHCRCCLLLLHAATAVGHIAGRAATSQVRGSERCMLSKQMNPTAACCEWALLEPVRTRLTWRDSILLLLRACAVEPVPAGPQHCVDVVELL
jgi:hypothetical protein